MGEGRERERKRMNMNFDVVIHSLKGYMTKAGPVQSQEPRTAAESPTWLQEPRHVAGSWRESRACVT